LEKDVPLIYLWLLSYCCSTTVIVT